MVPSRWAPSSRLLRRASGVLIVAFLAVQFVRPARPTGELPGNGTIAELVPVPRNVDSLLRRSCYDCHSANTRWPWYSRVAPVSWLIARDVRHGRSNLDFSRWSIDPVREPTPEQRFRWMCDDVRRDIMPPRAYLLIHSRARLTHLEKEVLCSWTGRQPATALPQDASQDSASY